MSKTTCKFCEEPFGVEAHRIDELIAGELEKVGKWTCKNPHCWEAPPDIREYDDGLPDFQDEKPKPEKKKPAGRRRAKVQQTALF